MPDRNDPDEISSHELIQHTRKLLDSYESRKLFLARGGDGTVDQLEWFNSTDALLHDVVTLLVKIAVKLEEQSH